MGNEVWIVDDEEVEMLFHLRTVNTATDEHDTLKVEILQNIDAAITRLSNGALQHALLDLRFPHRSGTDLLDALENLAHDRPRRVALMTSLPPTRPLAERVSSLRTPTNLIHKPISSSQVRTMLDEVRV
ncbi:MAG: hypothetical protein AAFX85_15450 [Pseudomonadota bacterium]